MGWQNFEDKNDKVPRHDKSYVSLAEETLRRQIWAEEMEMMEEHNKEAEVKMGRRMNFDDYDDGDDDLGRGDGDGGGAL